MISSQKILEISGVISGLLYTYLYKEGLVICWSFALLSSVIYLYLCFARRIYAESLLQAFYVFTGIYGWIHWNETAGEIGPNLPWNIHLTVILAGAGLVIISGYLLRKLTDAASPFLDSFTTVYSVFATLLMINLIPENWFYWVVIDGVSVILYFKRRLYFTAALFVLYTIIAVQGTIEWMNY